MACNLHVRLFNGFDVPVKKRLLCCCELATLRLLVQDPSGFLGFVPFGLEHVYVPHIFVLKIGVRLPGSWLRIHITRQSVYFRPMHPHSEGSRLGGLERGLICLGGDPPRGLNLFVSDNYETLNKHLPTPRASWFASPRGHPVRSGMGVCGARLPAAKVANSSIGTRGFLPAATFFSSVIRLYLITGICFSPVSAV
jgi:hypothetical protein